MNTRLVRFATRAARRFAAATSYLLKLLVIAYMIAPGAPRSGSEEVVFQLPLDRASHAFSIRQWSPADNAFIDTPLTNLQLTHLADDGTGQMTVQTSDSFLEATGTISLLEDFLLMDDSTGETGPPNLFGTLTFQRTSFLDTPWFPAGTAASSFFMTLPESRHGHVFTLFTQGVSYGLSTGPLLGYRSTDESGQPIVVPYGFFEGWTGTAPGGPYFLVDHTLGEQTETRPASNRDFISDTTWSAMSGQVPTRLVTLWVPDADAMNQFALHTAAGSVEWNYPSQGEGFDDSGAWHTGWRISGAIGVNQDFWLVREVDGATATGTMGIENLALDWTASFAPYEPPPPPDEPPYEPNWQTVTIQVGENHWSETILITMSDGSVVYPTADWSNQGYQAAYDMYWQEYYRYNYVAFTATIDANLGYSVSDASGHTDLMDGYNPPPPPTPPTPPSYQTISFPVGENHWTHPITVQMDDGSTVVAEPDWSTQSYQTAVDAWNNVYYTYAYVSYFASVDINQGYFIVDSEGHTDFMDGFNPPPPPDYQTISIPVGENHWGHPIQITLGNGSVVVPEPDWSTQGWQAAFDANGADYYHYNYVNYVATFDVSQGYTVSDGEGHTDLMDGFNPPPPPGTQIVPPGTNLVNVQVGENHWGHVIRFHLSDGTTVEGSPDWLMIGSVSAVDASGSSVPYNFVYYTATIDSSLSVVSIDDGEGHTDFMDGASPCEPPPQEEALYLQIAASRWDHAFEVRTSDGGVYPVGADQMQGFWTADQTSQSWWTSYYYFNATSTTRTGINWWVVDLTTGETADPNANDLSTWAALDAELDTDSDGLKDWYERLIGTNPNDPNTDGDNMNDGAELTVGRNPRVPDDPLPPDADADGLSDEDEVWYGTNTNSSDSDGDGITDGVEIAAGTNPNDDDTDNDGIPDSADTSQNVIKELELTSASASAFKPGAVDPNTDDAGITYLDVTSESTYEVGEEGSGDEYFYESTIHKWKLNRGLQWTVKGSSMEKYREISVTYGIDIDECRDRQFDLFSVSPAASFSHFYASENYSYESYDGEETLRDAKNSYYVRGRMPQFVENLIQEDLAEYGFETTQWTNYRKINGDLIDDETSRVDIWASGNGTWEWLRIDPDGVEESGDDGGTPWPTIVFGPNLGSLGYSLTLSSPYSDSEFVSDVMSALPSYRSTPGWDYTPPLAKDGSIGIYGARYQGDVIGNGIASRYLSTVPSNKRSFTMTRGAYWYEREKWDNRSITWMEVFNPADGNQPELVRVLNWAPSKQELVSPTYVIDPSNPEIPGYGRDGTYTLLPVEFKKMWETPNKANQIVVKARRDDPKDNNQQPDQDNNIYGTPRYLLYVTADPSDGKYHVSVDVHLGMRDQFVCAAYRSGSKVSGTDKPFPAADDQPADLLIPASGSDQGGEDFVIKIAFDANKNGLIDSNETLVNLEVAKSESGSPAPPMVRGFSSAAVTAAHSTIQGQSTGTGWTGWKPNWLGDWFVPNAIALESLFYFGSTSQMNSNYQPTQTIPNVNIDAFGAPGDFNEWLTHHTGAAFNPAGVASINEYKWNNQTRIASLIASSSPLSTLRSRASIVSQMQAETNATVDAFRQSTVPAGQTQTFPANVNGHDLQPVLASLGKPHWSPSWVPVQTLLIGDQDGYAGAIPDDAFGTVGRSRFINGSYWFVVKKENRVRHYSTGDPGGYDIPYVAVVVYLRVSGTSEDLYDFNHHAGGLSVPAAITQLSYGNGSYGRTHGLIYRTTVDILKDYEMREVELP